MKQYKKKIKQYKKLIQNQYVREAAILEVIEHCQNIRPKSDGVYTSYFDFLLEQCKFIKKKWWILQGCVLIVLWLLLNNQGYTENAERITGIFAVVFSVLIIPEIWKNQRFSAIEIEKASFYSLRQICAARILLFAMVDLSMVTLFFTLMVHTTQVPLYEIIINFLIPFNVSGSICFRLLYGKWHEMEWVAVCVSMLWIIIWSLLVTWEPIYNKIAQPIWIGLVLMSFGYLVFSVQKSQFKCDIIWEDKPDGIRI